MIYQLPTPQGNVTHIRITQLIYAPGSGCTVRYLPGRMVNVPAVTGPDPDWTPGEGEKLADAPIVVLEPARTEFQPIRMFGELKRNLTRKEMDAVRALAKQAGAPTTAGEQEWRFADLLPKVAAV